MAQGVVTMGNAGRGGWWQRLWAALFGIAGPLLSGWAVYIVISVWPLVSRQAQPDSGTGGSQAGTDGPLAIQLFWDVRWTLTQDQGLLLLAAVGGALGGLLYTMGIYSRRRGRGKFNHQDANWYWVRFIVGAGLGLAVYALMRAGLFLLGGQESEEPPSADAVLAVSIVVGLFTDKVLSKLKEIAGNFFASTDELAEESGGVLAVVTPRTLVRGRAGQQLTFHVDNGGKDLTVNIMGESLIVASTPEDANTYVVAVDPKHKTQEKISVELTLASKDRWTMTIPLEEPTVPSATTTRGGGGANAPKR